MATVCAKVLKHHKKVDGSYNVKVRIIHNREKRYIDTEHFVTDKQLSKNMAIKDPIVNRLVNRQVDEYRVAISELGEKLTFFSAEMLRDYLSNKNEEIDFVKFCDDHISQLKNDKRDGTAANHTTVRNSLVDYFNREKVSVFEITASMLKLYEGFLRGKRSIVRINHLNREVSTKSKGVSDSGIYNYMRDLRTLFNAAREKFNDEELGIIRIPHYPFKKYKVGTPPATRKRNITLTQLVRLRDCKTVPGSRAELAKEMFMLSFYLCGINAVDIYNISRSNIINGRLEYNRCKTVRRRKDNAFISIKLVDEAAPLVEKYIEKMSSRYSTSKGFDGALSKGMKDLRIITNIRDITFYWARHSFANCARNDCKVSKDDIALSLNHIDNGHRTTDIYLSKDWKIIDDVQLKVNKLLKKTAAKLRKQAAIAAKSKDNMTH